MERAKKRILVVEDEKNIAELLAYNIRKAGYACDVAYDGRDGLNRALSEDYDIILLDIMLPFINGFDVCRTIRTKSNVPIIFVTAREEEKDKILGLETGADDYVTKPFSVRELLSRIKANIRRSSGELISPKKNSNNSKNEKSESTTIIAGDLNIDCEHYSVTKAGVPLELSKKEYDLLVFFTSHIGRVYSREDLLAKVWGYDGYYGDIRTVDVTISRLRDKIEDDPAKPIYILTKRGVGYYFQA